MKGRQQQPKAYDRILAAADELFYYDGIAATGIDAVVQRAQVALGSVYRNFGGKAALVEAYLRRRDHQWRAAWETAVAEGRTAHDRALAIFDALRAWTQERGAEQGCAHLAALVQLDPDHPGHQVARQHKQHVLGNLRELIAATGHPDPTECTHQMLIIYEGTLASLAISEDNRAIDRGRRLAETLLPGSGRPDHA